MRVEKSIENVRNCMCLSCPSYTKWCRNKSNIDDVCDIYDVKNLDHLEMLFCAFDKSDCIKEHKGCLCAKCDVHKKYALNNEDYCIYSGGVD